MRRLAELPPSAPLQNTRSIVVIHPVRVARRNASRPAYPCPQAPAPGPSATRCSPPGVTDPVSRSVIRWVLSHA